MLRVAAELLFQFRVGLPQKNRHGEFATGEQLPSSFPWPRRIAAIKHVVMLLSWSRSGAPDNKLLRIR